MQILTDINNVVVSYGVIEKGIYEEADPSRELFKTVNDEGTFYAVTDGFVLHEVDELPSDFAPMTYCYTADKGFYANPNYVEPTAPVEDRVTALETENAELKAELAQTQEVLDYLLMNEE